MVILRKAEIADAEKIAKLLVRSIRELCGPDYDNDEELLSYWCRNKTKESMERGLLNPQNCWVVAEENETLCGVAMLTLTGRIELCYLLPGRTGRGVGRQLIDTVTKEALNFGLRMLTLESTRTALEFYKHLGFTEIAAVDCGGKIPGFAMEKYLNK